MNDGTNTHTTTAEAGAHTHNLPASTTTTATGNTEAAAAVAGAVPPAAPSLTDEKGNPTEYQIQLWGQAHGRKIKVVLVGEKLICFKHPARPIVEAANEVLMKTKKPSKFAEIILKNCQLNFIEETAADDEIYYALTSKVDEIITGLSAELKN